MRVAIVGAMPHQAKMLTSEFPGLDLRFTGKESQNGSKSDMGIMESADRIVVLTRFINHSLFSRIDRSKATLLHGGMTKLREILQMLQTTAKLEARETKLQTDTEEASMATTYFNFEAFSTAKPGDLFTYTRPSSMSKDKFNMSMQQARSYYKKKFGVLSQQEIIGDKCNVLITSTNSPSPDAVAPSPTSAPVVVPPPQAPVAPPMYLQATPMPVTAEYELQQLWRNIYERSFHQNIGATDEQHKAHADAAVDAFRAKFR